MAHVAIPEGVLLLYEIWNQGQLTQEDARKILGVVSDRFLRSRE